MIAGLAVAVCGPARVVLAETVTYVNKPVPSLGSFRRASPYGGRIDRLESRREDDTADPRPQWIRTVCVRTCDGYYWPISRVAPRSRLYWDARRCQESCDDEARLYVMPAGTNDIAGMTDFTGRTYASLANAFVYRQRLMPQCYCRPAPWTPAAAAIHSRYENEQAGESPPAEGQ